MLTVRPSRAFLVTLTVFVTVLLTAGCTAGPAAAPTVNVAAGIPTLPPLMLPGLPTVGAGATANAPATGHVGDTLKFAEFGSHSEIDATLVKVFDPAVPVDASTTLPAGAHWVGVEMSITNNDSDISGQSSTVDATASDGSQLTTDQVYEGFSRPIGDFEGCTDNPDTEQDAQQGVPYTNCQAFVVPNGQTLKQVGLKVGGAEIYMSLVPNDQAVWLVP